MSQTEQQTLRQLIDKLRADESLDEQEHQAVVAKLDAVTAQNVGLAQQLKDALAANAVDPALATDLADVIAKLEASTASLSTSATPAGTGADTPPAATGAVSGGQATLGGGTPTA